MKAIATVALVLVALPAAAKEHPKRRAMHTTRVHERDVSVASRAHAQPAKPCFHDPVTIMRGTEEDRFSLTRCDGSATPEAVDRLTMLARPESIHRPAHGPMPAGLRRIDARLAERLQRVADHFAHRGQVVMHVISGIRPNSVGSFHATAQALDFRVDGIRNEELVDFCKTLPDTGCGYYPNSSFVHMDVRAPGTGHVTWIDASGPGEAPRYVSSWPPPPDKTDTSYAEKLARILPPLPVDEHPARVNDRSVGEASAQIELH